MTDGWVSIHRQIFDNSDLKDNNHKLIFIYLITMASHKSIIVTYRNKKILLNRGQVAITIKDLARKFNLSTKNIRTIISNLKKTNQLATVLAKQVCVYTIVNYNKFQDSQTATGNQTGKQNNKYIYNTIIGNKHMKREYPILKPLKDKIKEPIKPLNEWQVAKSKLTDAEFEIWVKSRLNS